MISSAQGLRNHKWRGDLLPVAHNIRRVNIGILVHSEHGAVGVARSVENLLEGWHDVALFAISRCAWTLLRLVAGPVNLKPAVRILFRVRAADPDAFWLVTIDPREARVAKSAEVPVLAAELASVSSPQVPVPSRRRQCRPCHADRDFAAVEDCIHGLLVLVRARLSKSHCAFRDAVILSPNYGARITFEIMVADEIAVGIEQDTLVTRSALLPPTRPVPLHVSQFTTGIGLDGEFSILFRLAYANADLHLWLEHDWLVHVWLVLVWLVLVWLVLVWLVLFWLGVACRRRLAEKLHCILARPVKSQKAQEGQRGHEEWWQHDLRLALVNP